MEQCATIGAIQIVDNLAFEFKENPQWRRKGMESTSDMLQEISEMRAQFECLTDERHPHVMEVEYVHHSNLGEGVGTQTYNDTKALVSHSCLESHSRDQRETINTFKALHELKSLHTHMEHSGLLTVDQICDIHAIVLDGLHPEAGKLRETTVFTRTDRGIHFYPCPEIAEQELYNVIDRHNIHMEALEKKIKNRKLSNLEKVTYVIKCAAWLLFHFVDTHPFIDGNGRTCRLLGNYILSLVTPFPVSVYSDASTNCRRDYVDAIVKCRENPKEGPSELAAMMVEGLWVGWKRWKELVESSQKPICRLY